MAAPNKPYLLRDAGLLVCVMEVLYLGVQWGVAHLWDSWKISGRQTWVLQGQDCLSSHTYTPFFLQCIEYNSQHCKTAMRTVKLRSMISLWKLGIALVYSELPGDHNFSVV